MRTIYGNFLSSKPMNKYNLIIKILYSLQATPANSSATNNFYKQAAIQETNTMFNSEYQDKTYRPNKPNTHQSELELSTPSHPPSGVSRICARGVVQGRVGFIQNKKQVKTNLHIIVIKVAEISTIKGKV